MSASSAGPGSGPAGLSTRRRRLTGAGLFLAGIAFVGGVVVGTSLNRPAEGAPPKESVLDQAANKIASEAAKPIDRAALDQAAVEGMLRALNDRWAAYYTPSQYTSFTAALQGRYTGVGLWLRPSGAGVAIASVQADSPAADAGLVPGERLVAVDSKPVGGQSVSTVAEWLRGAAGTQVTLVVSGGGEDVSVTLTRTDVSADPVTVEQLAGSVLSIKVSAFTKGVGAQVRAALAANPSAYSGGIILDLRDDPGGLVSEAVSVAGVFLPGGVVVTYDQRGSAAEVLKASGKANTTTPLVVLVDGNTASAAEIVTGALQDRGRAVVVGSQTYGKGSVQEPMTLTDGSAIELTIGKYYTPSGRAIDGVGITPDVVVPASDGPDAVEQRALGVLDGLAVALGSESN
jgi:carboxyl-terminal processing protease